MNWKKLLKEPRILIALAAIVISLILMKPSLVATEDGTYSITTDIRKGLDLQGGVRALVVPEDQNPDVVSRTAEVLSSRISAFGLQESVIRTVTVGDRRLIEIQLAGATPEQLEKIIEQQGKFEAKIDRQIDLANDQGVLRINNKDYVVIADQDSLSLDNKELTANNSVVIDGISFSLGNITENEAVVLGTAITGADVTQVFRDPQNAIVSGRGTSWGFQFAVSINQEAAKKFEKLVMNSPVNGAYLESRIFLLLDNEPVDTLSISSGLRTGTHTQISISGGAASKEEALENMKQLQSILASGALPTPITVEQITTVSPTLGDEFMKLSLIAIFGAILAVSIVIFVRYRDPKLAIPIVLTSSLEVVMIFGVTALLNATIDLAAIAGIIAAIGTGVDNQILIADETKRKDEKEEVSMKGKIKSAFGIIFVAAATTGAAMIPLMIVGAGAVKGFALTTLIGVAIGILVTRPAFAKIVEYLE